MWYGVNNDCCRNPIRSCNSSRFLASDPNHCLQEQSAQKGKAMQASSPYSAQCKDEAQLLKPPPLFSSCKISCCLLSLVEAHPCKDLHILNFEICTESTTSALIIYSVVMQCLAYTGRLGRLNPTYIKYKIHLALHGALHKILPQRYGEPELGSMTTIQGLPYSTALGRINTAKVVLWVAAAALGLLCSRGRRLL